MRPSFRLLKLLALWLVLAVVIGIAKLTSLEASFSAASSLWWTFGVLLFLLVAFDWFSSKTKGHLHITRHLPAGLAVGTNNTIEIIAANRCSYSVKVKITEKVDQDIQLQGLPVDIDLSRNEQAKLEFVVHPTRRGSAIFEGVDVLVQSRFQFWAHRGCYLEPEEVRVFPNFTAVSNFELLAHGHMIGQMGVHLNQRRGEGTDFHQMREFRPGDALRQVDWKATARALKPISKEFQDERDQDIIFLLDNGRRMRSKDGELSHFDHCLNAFLLCSYVALRQGDAVGLQTFGGTDRWLSPIKGKNNLNTLMHCVYDLHSTTATSDYLAAAKELMNHHRKRSLVIIISNVDEQDSEDLLNAYNLLKRNHLVIFACLKERSVDEQVEQPVWDFMQALRYSAAVDHQIKRSETLKHLLSAGAIVLDNNPSSLHIALVNEYLALKRSGRI